MAGASAQMTARTGEEVPQDPSSSRHLAVISGTDPSERLGWIDRRVTEVYGTLEGSVGVVVWRVGVRKVDL